MGTIYKNRSEKELAELNGEAIIREVFRRTYGLILLNKRIQEKIVCRSENPRDSDFCHTSYETKFSRNFSWERKCLEDDFVSSALKLLRWLKITRKLGLISEDYLASIGNFKESLISIRDFREHSYEYASLEGHGFAGKDGRFPEKYVATNPDLDRVNRYYIDEGWTVIEDGRYLIGGNFDLKLFMTEVESLYLKLCKEFGDPSPKKFPKFCPCTLFCSTDHSEFKKINRALLEKYGDLLKVKRKINSLEFQELRIFCAENSVLIEDVFKIELIKTKTGWDNLASIGQENVGERLSDLPLIDILQGPLIVGNFGVRVVHSEGEFIDFYNSLLERQAA